MNVSGHKVLITGGSSGIGLALARAFRDRNNSVLICARRTERLTEAARQLPGVHTVQCDVAKESDLERLVREGTDAMGGLSILVNNAGIQFNDDFGRTDSKTILGHVNQEIGVNFAGLVKLTALCIPLLRRESESAVVNISSILAIAPKQSAPVYCATKAAVRSFCKSLRYQLEEGAPSIRVIEVLPPLVDTEMTRGRRGQKMAPKEVADDVLRGLEKNQPEILVGATKKLALVNRVHPLMAERMVRWR